MLLVLAVMLTLLFVSTSLLFKMQQKITFDTYRQQFKILTYEAYARGRDYKHFYYISCNENVIKLSHPVHQDDNRILYWPKNLRADCIMNNFQLLQYTSTGVHNTGTIFFEDVESKEQVRYSVNFTYGRLRETR
jgi:hypothetical protein